MVKEQTGNYTLATRKVYNPLNRFIRRVKTMQLGTVLVSLGGTGMVVGVTILLFDTISKGWGGVIAFLGIALIVGGYAKTESDDKKEIAKRITDMNLGDNILKEIKDMNKNIKDVLAKIG